MDLPSIATAPDAAPTPPASPVADLDLRAAWQEGWTLTFLGVMSDGSNRVELTRVAITPGGITGFARDQDAWEHVVTRARAGSALHRDALTRLDRLERMLVEAFCGAW